ncbi:MAG: DUF222 domain-containing protein [Gemmatimonadales bacterium]
MASPALELESRMYTRCSPHLSLVRETSPVYGTTSAVEDDDALEELGDEIATLAAHIHAATHRLLVMIADFDRRRGWELSGHRSCAHWLAFRTGIDLGVAREKVRTARALEQLPETGASMARGELSFSQVRALSRVARPENEGELLPLAKGCTTAQLERMVRGWKRGSTLEDEIALERERQESRTLSVFPDLDGMYVVRGRLPPEMGVLLMRAIEAASDHIYREQPVEALETDKAAAQRRADALALLAERAMAAGLGSGPEGDEGGGRVPISGTRAERYQVVLHVSQDTLAAGGRPAAKQETLSADAGPAACCDDCAGRSELDDGTRVSPETSRRLACDAGLVRMRHGQDGQILDVGRKTRTVPPALRRALEARDRGCRFPGCGLRFTDGHHVRHWADDGETSLANMLLLCSYHHMLVHEGGWRVEWWGSGRPAFLGPRGQMLFEGRWQSPELGADAAEALIEENRTRGIEPDGQTAGARWNREADIPDDIWSAAAEAALL